MTLTSRRRECLAAVQRLTDEAGFAPTHRELMVYLELKSTNATAEMLDALEEMKLVKRNRLQARTVRLTRRGRCALREPMPTTLGADS